MCILLVEDEEFIREFLVEELDFQGFEVCESESGEQAAGLIKNPPKRFTLLITDIHLPGTTNGIAVARLMRLHYPELPIIYATGRPDMLKAIEPLGPNEALVVKPYTPKEIVNVVRQLLGETPPGPA